MRNKLGAACILLGLALILGAWVLYGFNREQAQLAEEAAVAALTQLVEQIPEEPPEELRIRQLIPQELKEPEDLEMTRVNVNGQDYIGYLSFPSLELELPVLADWSYELLQKAPCRYTGSTRTDDLVLMAHNYPTHFGRLSELAPGDVVCFTDMDGFVIGYQVTGLDVLDPAAVEEVTSGHSDLTLFTCTYGGKSRVTVYCDRIGGD